MSRIEEIQKIRESWQDVIAANKYNGKINNTAIRAIGLLLDEYDGITAENTRLRAERDVAVEEIKGLLFHVKEFQCNLCKHHASGVECSNDYICISPKGGGVPSGWEWRGEPREERENDSNTR